MIGKVLRQRYKIVKKLSQGGFGETYIAEDLDIPTIPTLQLVVKRLNPQTNNPEIFRLFKQEAEVLYQFGNTCEQIPKLDAYFEENSQFYLIQEYIEGKDLSNEIPPSTPWSESATVQLLQDILEILIQVHQQNIIHRDIKPQNIIRRNDGKLFLIDFGAVKQVGTMQVNPQGQTFATVVIGTHGYMPNEQAAGKPKLSSDVYAVGIIGIQALTGLPCNLLLEDPQTGEISWRHLTNISDSLASILCKMVASQHTQRYATAFEALQALRSPNQQRFFPPTVTAVPSPVTVVAQSPVVKPPKKQRRWITLAIFVVCIAITVVGIGVFREGSPNNNNQNPSPSEKKVPKAF